MRRAERKRFRYLTTLFQNVGMEPETARFRAHLLLGFLQADTMGRARTTRAEKERTIEQCIEYLLG